MSRFRHQRIAVLGGGLSAEREISLQSSTLMAEALRRRGYDVVEVDPGRRLERQLVDVGAEAVLIGLHGTYGEDGCVQGVLECMGLPYTGSPPLASALAMDKTRSKSLFQSAGLPTPGWTEFDSPTADEPKSYPRIVKPVSQGSSVGLHLVTQAQDWENAVASAFAAGDGRVLVEDYVEGAEISIGLLDGNALGSVEIRPAEGLYDYAAKYDRDDTMYVAPAPVPEPLRKKLHDLAERAHTLLGCSGASRVDFRVDQMGQPWIIELNTLPGMTTHSLLPMTAQQAMLEFDDLVERIMNGARCHHHIEDEP